MNSGRDEKSIRDELADLPREPIDPVKMARRDLKKALPRRFWTDVSVAEGADGFAVELDGRPVRTPAKLPLVVPTRVLADLLAGEWQAQTEMVDPDAMPMTRLVNTALDGVARNMAATIAETAKFAETDLVCYRAGDPDVLVAAQSAAWDPVLDFARDVLGARFICAEGVMFVEQSEAARDTVRRAVASYAEGSSGAIKLAALSLVTNLTGSVLIALAFAHGAMSPEAAWTAAQVDETYQAERWGADDEAVVRRERRWRDMRSAAAVYAAVA